MYHCLPLYIFANPNSVHVTKNCNERPTEWLWVGEEFIFYVKQAAKVILLPGSWPCKDVPHAEKEQQVRDESWFKTANPHCLSDEHFKNLATRPPNRVVGEK